MSSAKKPLNFFDFKTCQFVNTKPSLDMIAPLPKELSPTMATTPLKLLE